MRFLTLTLLLFSITLHAETPWPKRLINRKSLPKVLSPTSDSAPFVYESKSFQFISDKKLDINKVRQFAKTAESVPAVVGRIPLPLLHMPVFENGAKPSIHIFSTPQAFERAGGPAGAAGYYSGRQKTILLRSGQFINIAHSRSMNYHLLVHELTHLCNHGILGYVPPWFSEGTAEYISAAFVPKGSYEFDSITNRIKTLIGRRLPRDKHIHSPKLNTLLHLSNSDWKTIATDTNSSKAHELYCISLILVHHFYHREVDGRIKSAQFIKKCQQRRNRAAPFPSIITEEEAEALEKSLTRYWKTKGVTISFQ